MNAFTELCKFIEKTRVECHGCTIAGILDPYMFLASFIVHESTVHVVFFSKLACLMSDLAKVSWMNHCSAV